jgi:hypothetical protein
VRIDPNDINVPAATVHLDGKTAAGADDVDFPRASVDLDLVVHVRRIRCRMVDAMTAVFVCT